MNVRGPQTTDVQRARHAFHKPSRALGEDATPKEIKAAFKLAEAASTSNGRPGCGKRPA